jgi:hypothetical protein
VSAEAIVGGDDGDEGTNLICRSAGGNAAIPVAFGCNGESTSHSDGGDDIRLEESSAAVAAEGDWRPGAVEEGVSG